MKPDFDKEMDSLLRRGPTAVLWPAGASVHASPPEAASHPDADELSAYAENALPAAARTRYTSHLADCDECRKLVVVLSVAANAAGELEKSVVAAPVATPVVSAWLAWLGALFSPRTMRYAVPLVALCIVGAITFVAVRLRRDEPLTALQTSSDEDRRGGARSTEESPSASPADATVSKIPAQPGADVQTGNAAPPSAGAPVTSSANTNANPSGVAGGVAGRVSADVPAPPPPASAGPSGMEEKEVAELAKSLPKHEAETSPVVVPPQSGDAAAARRSEAPKPAPQEIARAKKSDDETAYNGDAKRQPEAANKSANDLSRLGSAQSPDDSRGNDRSLNTAGGGAAATSSPAREARAKNRRRASESERDDKLKDSSAKDEDETRGVGGHRFRRQSGAWVDVNYKTTLPTTGVRRGTEGYRALVADIPELGRIAEQLSGEIVVVIKGRSYRIR